MLIIGDGAVGLCAVIAAKRLGAERLVPAGRHEARTGPGPISAPPTSSPSAAKWASPASASSPPAWTRPSRRSAPARPWKPSSARFGTAAPPAAWASPRHEQGPIGPAPFRRNITLTGGADPARAYIPELLADVLDGTVTPGRVFNQNFTLDQTPDAHRAMADRQVLKALIRPRHPPNRAARS